MMSFVRKSSGDDDEEVAAEVVAEFLGPVSEGFTVYTKKNCRYCFQLADLLARDVPEERVTWIAADAYISDGGAKKARFLAFIDGLVGGGIKHRTFPRVFIDGKFVGGFSDTEEFLFWRKDQRFNVTF